MATRRYTGAALPVAQVNTITVANTWATNDTATLTINGRDLVLTVGTDTTTAQVATAIKEMINGDAQTGTGNHTFSETGDNVPEFQEVSATVNSSVVTVTGVTKGVPFTLTVTESTAGSGTATGATATAASGPNHYDNADNWSSATLPVDGDTVIVEGDVDVLYGASQSAVTPAVLKFVNFSGRFGLPDVNEAGGYREYRTKFLAYGASGDATNMAVTVDCDSSRIRLDGGTGQMTINVIRTGSPETTDFAFEFKGSHASNTINATGGSVGIGIEPDDASTVCATLRVANDAVVESGAGVSLTTITQTDGDVEIRSNATTITQSGGILGVNDSATVTTLTVIPAEDRSAVAYYRSSGTLTNLYNGGGGVVDFREDDRGRTVTNAFLYEGFEIHDPDKTVTFTNGIDLVRCGPLDGIFDVGSNFTLTPSAL